MATQTTNLELIKPAGTDYVLVSDFNNNADTLDGAIGDLDALQTTEKGSLVGAINDTLDSVSTTVNVGTTTTGAAGTSASVTNVGTNKDAVFNFTIPRGENGLSGTIDGTTATTFTGLLKGNGSNISAATAGVDYASAAQGLPAGGAVGQALIKSGTTDFVTEWAAVGRTNHNLLHNWDWRTPVNQRAATGAVSNAYCIDRWIGNGTVTPSAGNYVTLANGTTMIQRLEILPSKLYSVTHTVSIDIAGTIQSATLTFPSSGTGSAVSQALTGVTVELGFVDLGSGNTSSLEGVLSQYIPYVKYTATAAINVVRVKLELGSVSTLVYASSTPFGETQAICWRYYNITDIVGVVQTKTTTNVYLISTTNFPAPMRIVPSVSGGLSQTFNGAIPGVAALTATITQMYASIYRPSEWRLTLSADVGSVGNLCVLYNVPFTADL